MAVSLMTPMAAAAIAVGLSQSASAADVCPPLASATITPPAGTVTAGSSAHVSAQISGWMLFKAHLQISGPGLNQQVGKSVFNGPIQGDVTVPKAGYFTLAIIGDATKCSYRTAGFSVKDRPAAARPTHSSRPSGAPHSGAGGKGSGAGAALPGGSVGNGAGGGNNLALNPLNGASPFSLPSVAPDGTGLGFTYPTPDPQVASAPTTQPAARNVSETTPIKWGQSLAIALVLLIISAHLGMWSRRQRLAAEGPRSTDGGKRSGGRKNRRTETTVTASAAAPATTQASATASAAAPATTSATMSASTSATTPTAGPATDAEAGALTEPIITRPGQGSSRDSGANKVTVGPKTSHGHKTAQGTNHPSDGADATAGAKTAAETKITGDIRPADAAVPSHTSAPDVAPDADASVADRSADRADATEDGTASSETNSRRVGRGYQGRRRRD
jgi:hypothetical protein